MNAKEIYSQWTNANNLPDYLKDQLNDSDDDTIHVAGTFYFNKNDVIKYEENKILFKIA